MKHDDDSLVAHFCGNDLLWMADKLGFGDELRARLATRLDETMQPFRDALDEVLDASADDTGYRAPEATDVLPDATAPAASSPRARDVDPPPPYELTFSGASGVVMLSGPAYAQRADYEAFVEAGGSVDTRGFAFELRGETLEERTQRIESEKVLDAQKARLEVARKLSDVVVPEPEN